MIDANDFLRQISAQAKADNQVPLTKLGYIDYDFDPSTYPQVLPRVSIDGQGLSERGYQCLSTYNPIPGDRVIMLPHGISYLILGAIDRTDRGRLFPGTTVLSLGKTSNVPPNGNQAVASGAYASVIFDTEYIDLVSGWSSLDNPSRFNPQVPGWYRMSGIIRIASLGSNGQVTSLWRKNGTNLPASRIELPVVSGHNISLPASSVTVYLNGSTDYVDLQARSNLSFTINYVDDASYSCRMDAVYEGDGNKELHRLDRS